MVKGIKIFIIFCSFSFVGLAQNIHLTQYYFSPLNYNPSYTGNFEGDYRIVGNYRSQWGAIMDNQFTTSAVSYEQVLRFWGQEFAVGGVFLHDNSGLATLMQNKLQASLAYVFSWKGNRFRTGVQTGLMHKGLDFNQLSFPNQYDNVTGEFNTAMDNNQNFVKNNNYLADVNLGVAWTRALGEKLKPEVGLSFMHLNQPKETFLGADNNIKLRSIYDVRLNYALNEQWVFTPTFLYMTQNKASELLYGALIKHHLAENSMELTEIFSGISVRDGFNRNYDAVSFMVGGKLSEFQLGISYDFNISPLSSATHYRGAFELSLIYIAKRTTSDIKIVPCDRL